MRAILIDESATSSGSHYYLGGSVTDAPALRHIETEMDGLAEFIADQVDGDEQSIELHGHDKFHGKAEWEPCRSGSAFLNRVRHTTETDPRARRSMAAIVGNIRSITVDEYVWTP